MSLYFSASSAKDNLIPAFNMTSCVMGGTTLGEAATTLPKAVHYNDAARGISFQASCADGENDFIFFVV